MGLLLVPSTGPGYQGLASEGGAIWEKGHCEQQVAHTGAGAHSWPRKRGGCSDRVGRLYGGQPSRAGGGWLRGLSSGNSMLWSRATSGH